MAKINNQFAFYKTKAAFNTQMSGDGFSDTTIIFIKDTQEIITHGAKICSMQDIISLLVTDYLPKTGGAITGDLSVGGTFSTETDINVGGIKITNGTADQILLGNGGVASLSEIKNSISSIPKFAISVVSALPTSNISTTTIYLLKSGSDTQNVYTEYIYVNNTWEKLGEQKLDLSGYALKSEAICSVDDNDENGYKTIEFQNGNGDIVATVIINLATSSTAGLLSPSDKTKLDGIEAKANNYTLPQATGSVWGGVKVNDTALTVAAGTPTSVAGRSYYVQKLSNGQLGVNVPWANTTYGTATSSAAGLMSAADKAKLDLISWYEGN